VLGLPPLDPALIHHNFVRELEQPPAPHYSRLARLPVHNNRHTKKPGNIPFHATDMSPLASTRAPEP